MNTIKVIWSSGMILLASLSVQAQDRSIQFEHSSWAEIKAKAIKENKTIFFDAYTSWCGPCKKLAAEVFTINEVADYFNQNFINAKFDMEKGEGPELAKLYEVRAYPTLMFINGDGQLVNKRVGALDFESLLEVAKKSKGGESLEDLIAMYKAGHREFSFMKKYLSRMEGLKVNIPMLVEEYFTNVKQEEWSTADNWFLTERYINVEESPVFQYVLAHKKVYERNFGAEAINHYLVEVYRNTIQKTANSVFAIEDLEEEKERFARLDFKGKDQLILECDVIIADMNKDYKKYIDLMDKRLTLYPEKNQDKQLDWMNEVCWKMLQKTADPYVMKKAADMASVSVKFKKPAFMDTYAHLLMEIGELNKAVAVEEEIIGLLKINPVPDMSEYSVQQTIEKFKRRK